MKKLYPILFLLLTGQFNYSQRLICIDSVSNYVGQKIKVCDKVTDTFQSKGDNKITYLNFGGKYPDHKFTVVIFPQDLINFPFVPIDQYKAKNVCITGNISLFKEKPQIIIKTSEQIEIK